MDEIKTGSRVQAFGDGVGSTRPQQGEDFGQIIKEAVGNAARLEKEADMSIMNLLQGKAEIHETMIALEKSDVSMRLMLTIRNKAIEAYKEIMHMQF